MKQLNVLLYTLPVLMLSQISLHAQPVVRANVVQLLGELPATPPSLSEAYKRAYPHGSDQADARVFYKTWLDKLELLSLESQTILKDFYLQHPTGMPAMPQQPTNRVSAKDQSAMDAATSELAQKMLKDPEFAKKFMQMSESEQHAYMAKALGDKGLKPVAGVANAQVAPIPGTDMDWATPCTDYMTAAMDMNRLEAQTALQQKYEAQHAAVRAWTEAEIKKLPLISFGEYGHDRDPEKVKAIQKAGLGKHREVASAMLQEASVLFAGFRRQAQQRLQPLQDALQKVNYGNSYSFGLNYTLVLQAQSMMFGDVHNLAINEIQLMEEIARWEYEWQAAQQVP